MAAMVPPDVALSPRRTAELHQQQQQQLLHQQQQAAAAVAVKTGSRPSMTLTPKRQMPPMAPRRKGMPPMVPQPHHAAAPGMRPQHAGHPQAAAAAAAHPHPHPHHHPHQPHHQAPDLFDVYRRMSAIPTDRELPSGLDEIVGDAAQRYRDLRAAERKLDAVMTGKRLAARDGQRYARRLRTMRVWISSTSPDKDDDLRMEDTFDFSDEIPGGSFKMKIEGRLLPEDDGIDESDDESNDDDDDNDADSDASIDVDDAASPNQGTDQKPAQKKKKKKEAKEKEVETHKFSHFFKRITVEFKPSPYAIDAAPVPPPVEWKKPEPLKDGSHPTSDDANFDCLQIERRLEESVQNVVVYLERAEPQGRVRGKLKEPLARLLDAEFEDQSSAMMGLHSYVRLKELDEEGHPQKFRCDEALKALFKRDTADFVYAPEIIAENIEPLPKIALPFTIKISSTPEEPTIYDIPILVEDPLDSFLSHVRSTSTQRNPEFMAQLKTIAQIDADIALTVQSMQQSMSRIAFFNRLAADPSGFIKQWVDSQKRDLEIAMLDAQGKGPEWSRGGKDSVWNSEVARESVGCLLTRPKPGQPY